MENLPQKSLKQQEQPTIVKIGWPKAIERLGVPLILVIGIVSMALIFGTLFILTLREPGRQVGKTVDKTIETAGRFAKILTPIAAAFRKGTFNHVFTSQMAKMQGSTKLHLAESQETQHFTKTSSSSTLWGLLPLPDITVEMSVPVTYVFFCDLNGEWRFAYNEEENVLHAVLPALQWHTPSIDTKHLEIKVQSSWLRLGEDKIKDELIRELTALAQQRAPELARIGKDTAKLEAQKYIETWLIRTILKDEPKYLPRIEVQFSDEPDEHQLLDLAANRREEI